VREEEFESFINKVLDGNIINDSQIEFVCKQLDSLKNRVLLVEILNFHLQN